MATKTKTVAPKKTAAPRAPKPAAAAAEPETAPPPEAPAPAEAKVRGPSLRIKGLIDRVSEATGGKRKDVKAVVEATLTTLGDALGRGEELNLPGFGRTRIARSSERDGASHMTLKVKRGPHKKRTDAEKEALAEDGEDS